jgi:hypothetical protein
MSNIRERRAARREYLKTAKSKPVGEGSRFRALEKSARLSGAKDAGAIAYKAGVKKYGKERMAKMAAAGRKK